MNKILFPTDFSKNAKHAFQFAKMMARTKKAKLILLFTYNLPLTATWKAFTKRSKTTSQIDSNLRAIAKKNMKRYTDELDTMEDDYTILIKEGVAADEIASLSKQEKVDLIVMGTKGESNRRDFLMGSTTVKVIEHVNTPLLVIPFVAKLKAFKNLVLATDLIYNSSQEIEKIIDFAKLNRAELTFLHVQINSEKEERKWVELEKIIADKKQQHTRLEVIQANNVEEGINTFLKENKTDLLVLSNHTKSLFEKLFHKSISKSMILHGEVPLLIYSKEIHPIVFF